MYQGVTWRRQVTITDEADPPNLIDPAQLVAVLCPEVPLTVTGPITPGVYNVELDATATALLCDGFATHWELVGLIGSDVVQLIRRDVTVIGTCARVTP